MYQLITQLQESINDKGIFKAVVMGGLPGSGKTYVASQLNDGNVEPRIVNTDKYYEYFMKLGHEQGSREIVDRSKILTKNQLYSYVDGMLPLLIDSTSTDLTRTVKRISMLSQLGYDIACVWVHTDIEVAMQRAETRERKVPSEFIKKAKELEAFNKKYLSSRIPTFVEIDNSSQFLDNEAISKAYKMMRKFYYGPIENPIGSKTVSKLQQNGQSTLTPTIYSREKLSSMIDTWYHQ